MSNSPSGSFGLPDVALDGRDPPGGRPADPLPGPVEHRLAQVDQGGVEVRQALQQLEGVVAGPAAHVEDVAGVGRRGRCRLGDQRHRQRRIDRGRLAGFQVGEPLHVGVEPLPDFIDCRFHLVLQENARTSRSVLSSPHRRIPKVTAQQADLPGVQHLVMAHHRRASNFVFAKQTRRSIARVDQARLSCHDTPKRSSPASRTSY